MRIQGRLFKIVLVVSGALILLGSILASSNNEVVRGEAHAFSGALLHETDGSLTVDALTYTVHLPLVVRDYGPRSSRLGYCATRGATRFPSARALSAGWYVNFNTSSSPDLSLGLEYVQTVRLHQLTTCLRDHGQYLRDRTACPYVQPYAYTLNSPSTPQEIVEIAQARPGSLWLLGNEIDRYDWGGTNPYNPDLWGDPYTGHQDEMLPEVYAWAYHDLYYLIKGADPTAKVANGSIIQATPVRIQYMTKVWNAYAARYGENMPVDVWNIHNFILKEACDDYGADVPPGYNGCYGRDYADYKHDDMEIFDTQIRYFRQWMKNRGQQNKPLIVSEYGILYEHAGLENRERVKTFMLGTFDYFMNTKDCDLGYLADDCRLVQRWAWYSLDDTRFNRYAYLINPDTGGLTYLGHAYADYAKQHLDVK